MSDAVSIPAYQVLGFQVGTGANEVAVVLELLSATGDARTRLVVALNPGTAGALAKQLGEAAAGAAAATTPASLRQ